MIDINLLLPGDSVYVRSRGWISNIISYVETGGRITKDAPSHEARIYSIVNNRAKLIEVVFKGKRFYWLDLYEQQGCKIWIKRDANLTENNTTNLLAYLFALEVKGYDWTLIGGFFIRFVLRKITPKKWKWNWITKKLENKLEFVCSEYQNAGRRHIGMNVKEQETPFDDMRKIPAEFITSST